MKISQGLKILNENEIADLYTMPCFDAVALCHYFSLPDSVLNSLKLSRTKHKNISVNLYFILQYGYFTAKHQFSVAYVTQTWRKVILMQDFGYSDSQNLFGKMAVFFRLWGVIARILA